MTGVLPVPAPGGEEAARARPTLAPILLLSFVLAACSLLYELLAAQTMSLLAANTVVWYSLVVGTFLASMGYGAFRSRRVAEGGEWDSLFRIEVGLTLIGVFLVPLLRMAHAVYLHLATDGSTGPASFVFYGTAAASVGLVGVLTGLELPLLMRAAREVRDDSRAANLVLGLDYLGSLAGAILFPVLLLPRMGLLAVGIAVAIVNLLAAAWILHARMPEGERKDGRILVAGVGVLLLAGLVQMDRVEQYLLRRFYYRHELRAGWIGLLEPRGDLPRVQHTRSAYQYIDIVHDVAPDFMAGLMPAYSRKLERDPEFPVDRVLFLNGDFQTNTRYEEVYHEWFAHVPIAASGAVPANVLLLGGGDGFLLRELLKYPGIRRVRHVDLDPVLVSLAKNDPVLHRANGDSFRDPRVETTFEDGFQFVRRSRETFDAVYVDFPAARNYDLAKLYSREFFDFLRRRIAPGGFAVFDGTGTSLLTDRGEDGKRFLTPRNDWPVYYNTLRKAGYPTIVPYLTTLETDNAEAAKLLGKMRLGPTLEKGLARISDPEERARRRVQLRKSLTPQFLEIQSVQLEQGFILLFPEPREIRREFTDPGIELQVLDAARYAHAFDVDFPQPEAVDESLVNSILRPTFPTEPWWQPRFGF